MTLPKHARTVVIGGGIMMVKTNSDEMAVTTGNAVTITGIGSGSPGATETGGLTRNQKIAIGAGTAAVVAAGGVALATSSSGGSGGSGGGGSPSSP